MTLAKRADGIWEGDFRFKGVPRLRLSMETPKKTEARVPHDAIAQWFRDGRADLIAQLRLPKGHPQRLTIAQVTRIARGEALATPNLPSASGNGAGAGWGTVSEAVARYLEWLRIHPKKAKNTTAAARSQLAAFEAFVYEGTAIGALPFDHVPHDAVLAYQRAMLDAARPVNSITAYIGRVRALYRWATKKEAADAQKDRRAPRHLYVPITTEDMVTELTARDRFLTEDEAKRLLAATPEPLVFVVAAALYGGFRLDEILHLRPEQDIDLELGTISIQRQPSQRPKEGWKPKTARSERTVPIAAPLKPVLERQLVRYASERWVVPAFRDGDRPMDRGVMSKLFAETVRAAELPQGRKDPHGVVFHTLRHTFASWLVMAGVDLYTVAQLLGDTLATVERTYAHLSPDHKRAALERLNHLAIMPPLDTEEG